MKHVMVAEKSLLAGDEVVDLLIEYGALLGQENTADSIELRAIGADGDEVIVTFLMNEGVSIVAETSSTTITEPDNRKAEEYLHSQISQMRGRRTGSPEEIAGTAVWDAAEPA
jgi:hypothetical protein